MNKILLTITVCLAISTYTVFRLFQNEREKRVVYQTNQGALLSDIYKYKIRDSLNGASNEILALNIREFDEHYNNLAQIIDEIDINIKRIEQVSDASIESRYRVSAPIQVVDTLWRSADSSGDVDGDADVGTDISVGEVGRVEYNTPYISLNGTIHNGFFDGDIETRDTLIHIVHRVPKKFLFIKYGIKELRQEVISRNPHTNITYSEYIKIVR